jgi:hypothetical protein
VQQHSQQNSSAEWAQLQIGPSLRDISITIATIMLKKEHHLFSACTF